MTATTLESLHDKIASCTRCTFCKWVPEIRSEAFAEICPSVHYGKFFSYTGGGKLIAAYALLHQRTEYTEAFIDNVYSCSMCGGCDTSCKTLFAEFVEPLDSLYALRRKVTADGHAPAPLRAMLDHLRHAGNALGLPESRRADWFAGLELKQTAKARARCLFHVGTAAFDADEWPSLLFVCAELARRGVDFAVGGADEPDTGGFAYDVGDQELAADLARRTAAWVKESGADTLIVYGDDSFSAFRNIYPRLGIALDGVEIVHVSQWLAQNLAAAAAQPAPELVTYHDSCRLGRLGEERRPRQAETVVVYNSLPALRPTAELHLGVQGVYDAPRHVLEAAGAQIVEMERVREFTFCCGAGGGAKEANPAFAQAAAVHRLREAHRTGAETLVTSCTACARHMKEVAVTEQIPIAVVGLVEFARSRQAAPSLTPAAEI
ncbi:(Fe-S)-binding protein [Ancylobacter sp. IITR112]|uniref:(Fe-S)-binding protein n=1 Tax=Ancylobacter sp. IITR112 TaxID=3138073 RepID=UPI00352A8713